MKKESQHKKLFIMNILEILKKYSDENHRLSSREIGDILQRDYGMRAERRAIRRNLLFLLEAGFDLGYTDFPRARPDGETDVSYTQWYLNRDFTDAELRLLIDSVLFSKHIPYSQCKNLIEKLKGLSNKYFEAKVGHICNLPENQPNNKQLFYTLEVLDEAIGANKQVAFQYLSFDTDKKLYPRRDSKGNVREYVVNPYQMVATNGRYYLICNLDQFDTVSYYRIERIQDIRCLDMRRKSKKQVVGLKDGLNLSKRMAEQIYMLSGGSSTVYFRAKRYLINEIIDWFGQDIAFLNETEETVDVRVTVNEKAMLYWAMQFGEHVEVLEPPALREQIGETVRAVAAKYENG